MNRLTRVVPLSLSLLLFGFAMQARAEANVSGPTASGIIKEAPANGAPVQRASASASAAASADASTPIAATSIAFTSASASSAAASIASAPSAPASAAPAIVTAAPAISSNMTAPLNWKAGPRDIALLDQAVIKIPQGYAYLGQDDARQFLRKLGNPNTDNVIGALTGPGADWLIVIRFNKVGYIRDEAPEWNSDELLATLKKNVEQTNEIRKKDGMGETEIVGWVEKPTYDPKRHRLIWAVSSRDKGAKESDFQSVNFNMYSLGREGYFNFNLVTDLTQLEQNKKFASIVASSAVYNDGKKYTDFKKGSDKASAYNVVGLVTGGDAGEKAEADQAPNESKVMKFFKIFGLIVLGILGLAGAAFGVYYIFRILRKRRTAKMAAETAPESEAESEAPASK